MSEEEIFDMDMNELVDYNSEERDEIELEPEEESLDNILEIKNTLLQPPEKLIKGNKIIEDNTFEKAGSNGVFDIEPKIVTFKGFESNKKNTISKTGQNTIIFAHTKNKYKQQVKVINRAKFSQRISVIPPTTPYFKVGFSRRGLIPTGLAEIINIVFEPQEYKYYNDYVRILCEGADNLIIPIHAYPLMDINKSPKYIPSIIQFKTVLINNSAFKELYLKNNIDSSPFEFEFVPIKRCDEIKIEPLLGDIATLQETTIRITFAPTNYGIFCCEYEFRLSEFGFVPVKIAISGTCNVFDQIYSEPDAILKNNKSSSGYNNKNGNKNLKYQSNSNTTKVNIHEKDDSNMNSLSGVLEGSNLKRLNITESKSSESKDLKSHDLKSMKSSVMSKGITKRFKYFPSNKERAFLQYYNQVDQLIQDKEIKYIQFKGKKLLTLDEKSEILRYRKNELNFHLDISRKSDLNLHSILLDPKKVCMYKNSSFLMKPLFSYNNNNDFFKTRKYFNTFLKAITKVIVQNRASKRMNNIYTMIKQHNIRTSDDFAEYVKVDWHRYLTLDEKTDEYNVKIKMNINLLGINKSPMYLSNDFNFDSLKQTIPHENNIYIDELDEYEKFERMDQEIMQYKEFKSPGISQYEINIEDKEIRSGALNEDYVWG